MKITVLTENTSAVGLPCEHGLSLYIESNGHNILFDFGQSNLFAENAKALGIDLSQVDLAVLSHGHYDHSGGMERFLELNSKAPVYLSKYAFESHLNAGGKDISVDIKLKNHDRLIFTDGTYPIIESISLHSAQEIPTVIDFGAAGLSTVRGGITIPDDFRHEQYLLIRENGKTVLFSGCAHKGIINIIDHFKPDVYIGGFHFMKMPLDKTLRGYAEKLTTYDIDCYTCHCTGVEQYGFIQPHTQKLRYIAAGDLIEV